MPTSSGQGRAGKLDCEGWFLRRGVNRGQVVGPETALYLGRRRLTIQYLNNRGSFVRRWGFVEPHAGPPPVGGETINEA